ncbi:hypothetical protein L1887_05845 [Cichorium endivia]|nr:hypothetical protein L1887_05845 [Cichorium endivia]
MQEHQKRNKPATPLTEPPEAHQFTPVVVGTLGSLCQIGTCTGIIASLFLGIFSDTDPHRTFNSLIVKAGRLDEAKKVNSNLWGSSEVDKSIEEFQSVLKNDGHDLDSRWSEILEEPHSKVAFIGDALFVLQHFLGINAVLYFSSLTFKDAGISNGALASLYVRLTNFSDLRTYFKMPAKPSPEPETSTPVVVNAPKSSKVYDDGNKLTFLLFG